ncbi:MAG: diaminopimelate epimerase [Sinobacteraceae bacterium]|nr:diaminopimelate epimerase [Nevskiaceae bacterium]
MRIEFCKMHGCGNDFMVFESPAGARLPDADQLRRLAQRHTGIGFDQALLLQPPRRPNTAVYYRIFNADGLEVEQCGNGARCIASLLFRRGRITAGPVTLDSPGGLVQARVEDAATVAVAIGVPDFDPRALPFEAAQQAQTYELQVGDSTVPIAVVSIGNPHAVLIVRSSEEAPVQTLGPAIENHPRFPRRVNVGFMQVVDRSHIRLRVYERGAGETLACGTGACAAVAVGRSRGLLEAEVKVSVRGGELRVNWGAAREPVWLTGPAEVSFEGQVEV